MKCPSCGYERKPNDLCPDWQCPACQKAYNKSSQQNSYATAQIHPDRRSAPQSSTFSKIIKHCLVVVLIGGIAFGGYTILVNMAPAHNLSYLFKDKQKLLAIKRANLHAYEDVLEKIDAELAYAEEHVGICPITGQPNTFTVTQDPRPELRDKIDMLREEIRLLEDNS
ncbi:hypothetical protein [uncultured Desulfuromonas sp.]|jgi:hypothetical protein|uniref:hypothetical protein n=1 Tax=uncultured Desulfuromonas sp. TaxID=181013 RepID=UPI002AABF76C|nr:hypothetical protein [uncultured Desulfuromonas sp.]